MITKLMGQVMGDMTAEPRRMAMKWNRTETKDPNDPESASMADNMEDEYEKYDWLFVFEAAMVTHLHVDCTVDATTILERQEKSIKNWRISNMRPDHNNYGCNVLVIVTNPLPLGGQTLWGFFLGCRFWYLLFASKDK